MKVTLTRDTLVAGNHVPAGKTVDVLEKHAKYLIGAGKAVAAGAGAPAKAEEAKPLERMNKAELLAEAADRELVVAEGATNAQIREEIMEHDAKPADPVPDDDEEGDEE